MATATKQQDAFYVWPKAAFRVRADRTVTFDDGGGERLVTRRWASACMAAIRTRMRLIAMEKTLDNEFLGITPIGPNKYRHVGSPGDFEYVVREALEYGIRITKLDYELTADDRYATLFSIIL